MTEKSDDGLFEWDAAKNIINIHKHEISFQEAIGIFKDQNRLEFFDENHSTDEEQRYITLGRLSSKNGHRIGCFHRQTRFYKDNIRKICIKKGGKALL